MVDPTQSDKILTDGPIAVNLFIILEKGAFTFYSLFKIFAKVAGKIFNAIFFAIFYLTIVNIFSINIFI